MTELQNWFYKNTGHPSSDEVIRPVSFDEAQTAELASLIERHAETETSHD